MVALSAVGAVDTEAVDVDAIGAFEQSQCRSTPRAFITTLIMDTEP